MPDSLAAQTSRPTVAIDGTESDSLTGGLLSLRVREDVHGLSNCEAEIGNWGPNGSRSGYLYFDRGQLDFGRSIDVRITNQVVFTGAITGIEARFPGGGVPSVVVLAEDRFQELRMKRRTRTFLDTSDLEVFRTVAGDHGLTPDIGVRGPSYRVLAQLNQSDLAFARERARALDAELWISDSTLHVQPRSSRNARPLPLGYPGQLRDFRVLADVADQATSIEVTGWDIAGKQAMDERADLSVLGGELAGGDSGPDVLSRAFGERKETIANAVPQTSTEARARAEAAMMRRTRRFLLGQGIALSDPTLRVGATVRLSGLGPLFDGDFYVAGATILFDGAQGLRTEIEVERGWLGRPQ